MRKGYFKRNTFLHLLDKFSLFVVSLDLIWHGISFSSRHCLKVELYLILDGRYNWDHLLPFFLHPLQYTSKLFAKQCGQVCNETKTEIIKKNVSYAAHLIIYLYKKITNSFA